MLSPELTLRITPPRPAVTSAWASARQHAAVSRRFWLTTSCDVRRVLLEERRPAEPCEAPHVVDRHVHAAERGERVVDDRIWHPVLAQVRRTGDAAPALGADLVDHGIEPLDVAVDDDDVTPGACEPPGDGPPDPDRGTRHERDAAGETEVDHGSSTTLIAPAPRSAATANAIVASSSGKRCVMSVGRDRRGARQERRRVVDVAAAGVLAVGV